MTTTPNLPALQRAIAHLRPKSQQVATSDDWIRGGLLVVTVLWLVSSVILPLWPLFIRSLQARDGTWIGLGNYARYFNTPSLEASFYHSLYIAFATTVISVVLGFIYAYALTRTAMVGKRFFQTMGLLTLYIPPLANAIGLIYIFGNQGLVTRGFFGLLPGWDINLYGANGIIIGEVLYCFPQAVILLLTALSLTDARLYEAAEVLGDPPLRTFFKVTIPSVKYGLISAFFICFILAFTDFGVPKVVGGDYNVLATDIYKQVVGQQNFSMGATISILLLIPSVFAFVIDRLVQRRQTALISAKAVPLQPKPKPVLDRLMLGFCGTIVALALGVFATVVLASLVQLWPYDFSLSLRNYDFSRVGGGGYGAFWNSLRMSGYTAIFGTLVVFTSAYLIEKSPGLRWLRSLNYFLSTLPLALPGLVLGIAYVFFFNNPIWPLPGLGIAIHNPFHGLYGTMALLVIVHTIHFYTVGFLTATTALKQIDGEFEAVSASMGVPFYKTFFRVTVPLALPAILDISVYYFVNTMVTVSALIFLYPPTLPMAAVAIINLDDAGNIAAAAAMSTLVVVTSLTVRGLYGFATKGLKQQSQAWLQGKGG
ncbi:putative 2-aminoethylphosphonate ABC transporter permease subunit [Leptolyngbya sp. PCC 6406]|uniref:putative 2-aminoethylphosphonate ABC transporter permease subunit n=1 Tax=Leptolyngbya sp. PCC 6406 TaxID=1173264 RepID=UPI0002ABE786|nr:putative 2-aminoethylphosphonate ABC transporter permease subunit [Leptolyngbya sp. PCC 6406]